MKLDITHLKLQNTIDWAEVIKWLTDNVGNSSPPVFKDGAISGSMWRLSKTASSVGGFYESTYLLEFDRESDASVFLLKWT